MSLDLRSFLDDWKQRHPDDIVTIPKEVSVEWYIQGIQTKLHQSGRDPILVFERPVTLEGRVSEHKLVTGLFMSRRRAAEIIGSDSESVAAIYTAKSSRRLEPTLIERNNAAIARALEPDDGESEGS